MASKSKTKDLEIIYNLQWKNKQNGADSFSVIGVYDIPATTLNWEVFKSYLLKNSGTTGEDVKISYITDNGKEYPIQSQTDFQVALYAFRRKARNGDVINLKLERISEKPTHKNLRHSNDVETQFDNEDTSIVSNACCSMSDAPPDWFLTYMGQLKKEITDELSATVSCVVLSALGTAKPPPTVQPSCHHIRKTKESGTKRRKHHSFIGEAISDTKHLLKTLKHERKLEEKLETLEARTKKLKEKKLALFSEKSSDSDVGHTGGARPRVREEKEKPKEQPIAEEKQNKEVEKEEEKFDMNAEPVKKTSVVPHMLGGEVYLHQWEVINTGSAPWTSRTSLEFTWGSKALEPLDKVISVPYLKPGEIGTVAVRLQIPNEPGQYECYWHFMHKGRRFGHWLGCQVAVDPFDLKGNSCVLDMSQDDETAAEARPFGDVVKLYSNAYAEEAGKKIEAAAAASPECLFNIDQYLQPRAAENKEGGVDEMVRKVIARVDHLQMNDPTDTNCSSDSDNQSVASLSGASCVSNASKCSGDCPIDEFVVVPKCFKLKNDKEEEDDDGKRSSAGAERCDDNNNSRNSDNSSEKDMVVVTVSKEQNDGDFACITIDGQKILIPKRILKEEYVAGEPHPSPSSTASNASTSLLVEKPVNVGPGSAEAGGPAPAPRPPVGASPRPELIDQIENNDLSHCSTAGSNFSFVDGAAGAPAAQPERLFIFPRNCPGYEVVQPPCVIPDVLEHQGVHTGVREGQVTALSVAANKEWQQSVTRDHRNDIVERLVRAVGPSSYPRASRIDGRVLYALTVECGMYVKASSRSEYYHLMAETIYKIRKEAEEMRRKQKDGRQAAAPAGMGHFQQQFYVPPPPLEPTPAPPLNLTTHDRNPFNIYNMQQQQQQQHVPNYQQTLRLRNLETIEKASEPLIAEAAAAALPEREAAQPKREAEREAPKAERVAPKAEREAPKAEREAPKAEREAPKPNERPPRPAENVSENAAQRAGAPANVHILPETLVSGAVNVASSAINRARSVISMVMPREPGMWVNGHWVATGAETPREANLQALTEMGFWNRDLNATLLARYNDDLNRVVAELVQ